MLAFQAPPEAVTMPVMRKGKMPGRMTVFQRWMRLKWKRRATSLRSEGMAMAPAMTLNRTYHWVPSSMRAMEPMPMPPPIRTRASSRMGKRAVAGTEAAIWAMGCATLARRGLKPMATPTGMVQAAASSRERLTRRKVMSAPWAMWRYSEPGRGLSSRTAWKAA